MQKVENHMRKKYEVMKSLATINKLVIFFISSHFIID